MAEDEVVRATGEEEAIPERPLLLVDGEKVGLGPHRRELIPLYQRWMNDFGTLRTLGVAPMPMTLERETAWYESVAAATAPNFTIYERATWRPIGTTSLMEVDRENRSAEFGILIGEAAYRGRGFGTETTRLMLDYAFTALGLHSVMLRVFEFNLAGQRAYSRAGFREFGRRRQSKLMGGRLWDTVYMECLASEFTGSVLANLLASDVPRA
jgi:RimJ/RimL family protein N-acetyltransferase